MLQRLGWQLTKALSTADRLGIHPYISQQINYSLLARDAEFDRCPCASTSDGDHGVESLAGRSVLR